MHCHACGRKLLLPAYRAPVSAGGWALGPVCVQKTDLPAHIMRVLYKDRTAWVMMLGTGDAPRRKRIAGGVPVTRLRKMQAGQMELGLEDVSGP